PGRIMVLRGGVYFVQAAALLGIAASPSTVLAIVLMVPFMATTGFVIPGSQAVMTLILPPNMRGVGLAADRPFRLLARVTMSLVLVIAPLVGGIAASHDQAILAALVIPAMLAGAILMSGASTVASDMRSARAVALAGAEAEQARLRGRSKMLICRDVDITYDGVQVLFGVDFDV